MVGPIVGNGSRPPKAQTYPAPSPISHHSVPFCPPWAAASRRGSAPGPAFFGARLSEAWKHQVPLVENRPTVAGIVRGIGLGPPKGRPPTATRWLGRGRRQPNFRVTGDGGPPPYSSCAVRKCRFPTRISRPYSGLGISPQGPLKIVHPSLPVKTLAELIELRQTPRPASSTTEHRDRQNQRGISIIVLPWESMTGAKVHARAPIAGATRRGPPDRHDRGPHPELMRS